MPLTHRELGEFLEEKYRQYDQASFIESDPVSIPHLFSKKEDIEIAAFIAAILSWGSRKSIIGAARKLMLLMDDDPHDFLVHASEAEMERFGKFYYRTFNATDCLFFLEALGNLYRHHGGLEGAFGRLSQAGARETIGRFRETFLLVPHASRSEKHLPDPRKGSPAKRINLFLRWMIRWDQKGVDFGIWKNFRPADLVCPLDIHSGRVARKLGLLTRKENDWKAAVELTEILRGFDPSDPVKYDFALFGLGIFEKF
jgi:uncharacterized protein (TIGR02757 family)